MKKIITVLVTFLIMVTSIFALSDNRKSIDKFFEEYEEFIEAYEKVAEKQDLMSMLKLDEELLDLTEQIEDIQKFENWTLKDAKKLLQLQTRLAKAVEKLTGNKVPSYNLDSFELPSFSF